MSEGWTKHPPETEGRDGAESRDDRKPPAHTLMGTHLEGISIAENNGTIFLQGQAHPPWKSQSCIIFIYFLGKPRAGSFLQKIDGGFQSAYWSSQNCELAGLGVVVVGRDAFLSEFERG